MPGGDRFRTRHAGHCAEGHAAQLPAERVTGAAGLEGAARGAAGAAGAAPADDDPHDGLDDAEELDLELVLPLEEEPLRRLLDDPDDEPPDEPDDDSTGAGAGTWMRRTTTTGGTVTGTVVEVGAGSGGAGMAASAVCVVACSIPKAATKPNIVAAEAPATRRRDTWAGCRRFRRRAAGRVAAGCGRSDSVIVGSTVV